MVASVLSQNVLSLVRKVEEMPRELGALGGFRTEASSRGDAEASGTMNRTGVWGGQPASPRNVLPDASRSEGARLPERRLSVPWGGGSSDFMHILQWDVEATPGGSPRASWAPKVGLGSSKPCGNKEPPMRCLERPGWKPSQGLPRRVPFQGRQAVLSLGESLRDRENKNTRREALHSGGIGAAGE